MTANSRRILFVILVFAFLVRVAGIGYGLPLWLIADEPPFTLGALKMIELKTVIPRFHVEEFRSILYYPTYISYFLLPAFSGILAIKYLSFDGDRLSFINYIGSDLSDFFLAARFLNILLAVFSIYLIYGVSRNIFNDEWSGLAASFLLSTSLLHIMLSIAARQWMPISLILLLVLYFLTHPSMSFKKRYFLSILISGIGIGISAISSVALFLVGFYFLLFEEKKLSELFREKFIYFLGIMFVALALVPLAIYPASIGFGGKISLFGEKSLFGLLASPFKFLSPLLFAEPILALMSIFGLLFAFLKNRKIFWLFSLFIIAYSMLFYLLFRFEDRFLTPLIPMIAILAGFGFMRLFSRWRVFIIVLILPLVFSLRLGYLVYKNDSRENMRVWIETNLKEGSKIIVRARLMRLAANAQAIQEKEMIAPDSLRQIDRSELFFGKSPIYPSFHALNISDLPAQAGLDKPILKNGYEFIALSGGERLEGILMDNKPIISFGEDSQFNYRDSHLGGSPFELFETKELGPSVSLYNLK